jgi:ribosomal protein S27E
LADQHNPGAYRAYRAACPNCGAAVEFRSAASASAVCSFCRSTLVREGDALRRIGESSELFDDHSPLQLGASGQVQGAAFTLVGRVQYAYADGRWTEWHALFDNERSGWLSEDNGAYVLAFDRPLKDRVPQVDTLFPGQKTLIDGRAWDVASVTTVQVHAAEGELPRPPQAAGAVAAAEFVIADLRNDQDEVGTLDYADPAQPQWSIGRAVRLAELKLAGLRDGPSEKKLVGRSIECPSCGASLEIRLDSTQSVTCGQCKAVVDVSQGVGADLAHYQQHQQQNAVTEPQIPLGRVGTLKLGTPQPLAWQVVGYLERCDLPAPGDGDEQTFWREYLLFHPTEGFVFLVDAEDGWSWARPLTGVPVVKGDSAAWAGARFKQRWAYRARTVYVLGEFYWRLRRDDAVQVTDYDGEGANRHKRLGREQTTSVGGTGGSGNGEVTWSAGEVLDAKVIATAFGLDPQATAALKRDAAPIAGGKGGLGCAGVIILLVLLLFIVLLISRCSTDNCDQLRSTFGAASAEYQQCLSSRSRSSSSGGSFGGFSSGGGGHK